MSTELESLVLVRHGLSAGNVDPTLYARLPDHCIPLVSPDNDAACIEAGRIIAAYGWNPLQVCVWHSPYLRCMQTARISVERAFPGEALFWRESFLLREQEFGDWDGLSPEQVEARDPERWARRKRLEDAWGKFYFRYPNGESRADVVTRMALFISKVRRSSFPHHLVFLHGVTQRALRMAWFNRPVEWFEHEPNPANASVLAIRRAGPDAPWFEEVPAAPTGSRDSWA